MKFKQVNAALKQQNLNVLSDSYREMKQKGFKSFMMFSLARERRRTIHLNVL